MLLVNTPSHLRLAMKVSIRLYISGDCAATVAPVLRKAKSKLQSLVYHMWNVRHPRSRTA
jgi:hypothetical protein